MKKNSYIKFLLSLMLVLGSLVGCQPNNFLDHLSGTQSTPEQVNDSQPSEEISIDTAYTSFKYAQKKFLKDLKLAVDNPAIQPSTKSNNVAQWLGKMQAAIKDFRTEELPKIDSSNQESVTKILDDIDTNLQEISEKVIAPLKNGLTKDSVEKVQRSLNFFSKKGISEKNYGNFSTATYEEIDRFLLTKNQLLEVKIRDLNFQKLFTKVALLEAENNNLKNTGNIAIGIALLAILISLFKNKRRKRNQINIASRKTQNNRATLSSGTQSVKKFIGSLFGQNKIESEEETIDETIRSEDKNLGSRPLENQSYDQIYNQLYNKFNEQFNERFSNLARQIDKRIAQRIPSTANDLDNRIEQILETRFQNYLPQERREQPQTRIQTWQDPQPTINQSPVVSPPPQDSNFSKPQCIDIYNRDPSLLSRNATEVSETEESLSNRRLGSSQAVTLATKRRGNYWILTEGGYDYLVPSQSLRINQHNYKTVEALFECRNYHPDYSDNFRLLKPAVVYPLSGSQTWQLQEPGILQF